MYCGSCLRDNTLVSALRRQGRDVTLVPLYTPVRTDEPDVSEPYVLYGAVNVYLEQKSALFRWLPAWLTRRLDAPALLRRVAKMSGGESLEILGDLTVSTLQGRHGRQHKELRKLIRALEPLRPDLVNLPNVMFVHLAGPIREALGATVICTLTGEDIFIDALPEPHRGAVLDLIRRQAADANGFVATSEYYAAACREQFAIPADRLHVIYPGIRVDATTDPRTSIPEPRTPAFTVGYLARICPAKGLHLLSDAIRLLRQAGREVRLVAAGNLNPADRPYLDEIRHSSGGALEYLGEVDRAGKLTMLRSIDVLSVPTVYREPKGLFVLEAMSQGVPVVQPRHGAFPELIEATQGGLLVDPHTPQALADGLARLMDDPVLREQLGRQGRAAVLQSFTDTTMAERTWTLYEHYRGTTRV
jgi:glycosyltransferase involved in cell wall biosynthesis